MCEGFVFCVFGCVDDVSFKSVVKFVNGFFDVVIFDKFNCMFIEFFYIVYIVGWYCLFVFMVDEMVVGDNVL